MEFYEFDKDITWDDIKKFNFPNQKIGVIAHIENEQGEILLQQRGQKSRDERGLFEDIGGKVEDNDISFKEAIVREIKEEAGEEINLVLSNSIGIYHCNKKDTNWIFIIFLAKYLDGEIKIMEPEKCIGYDFFTYDDAMNSDLVTESCKFLISEVKKLKDKNIKTIYNVRTFK